mmetsp:Transcript_93731/g.162270  ORF Transcript_93731/g.162270 Transcript_93731/m.162270 type:complete len:91 (-) Transcript_93731:256-528(-)
MAACTTPGSLDPRSCGNGPELTQLPVGNNTSPLCLHLDDSTSQTGIPVPLLLASSHGLKGYNQRPLPLIPCAAAGCTPTSLDPDSCSYSP